MKKQHLCPLLLICILTFLQPAAARDSRAIGKVLHGAGKLLTGTAAKRAATLSALGGAVAIDRHLKSGEAAYAIEVNLNNGAWDVLWADVMSKPDVFPVLRVAGMGEFLVPDVSHE